MKDKAITKSYGYTAFVCGLIGLVVGFAAFTLMMTGWILEFQMTKLKNH